MGTICTFLLIYSLVIFARVIFSWIRVTPDSPLAGVHSVVFNLTEPVLGPLRRAIPPVRMGMASLDLSPLIILIGISLLC